METDLKTPPTYCSLSFEKHIYIVLYFKSKFKTFPEKFFNIFYGRLTYHYSDIAQWIYVERCARNKINCIFS